MGTVDSCLMRPASEARWAHEYADYDADTADGGGAAHATARPGSRPWRRDGAGAGGLHERPADREVAGLLGIEPPAAGHAAAGAAADRGHRADGRGQRRAQRARPEDARQGDRPDL